MNDNVKSCEGKRAPLSGQQLEGSASEPGRASARTSKAGGEGNRTTRLGRICSSS